MKRILLMSILLIMAMSTMVLASDYKVTATVLNVREGSGTEYDIVGKLVYGDHVVINSVDGDWASFTLHGEDVYIHKSYIRSLDGTTSEDERGQEIVDFAMNYLGYRYTWGGQTPSGGFDCGGLVKYVYNNFGENLTMGARNQYSSIDMSVSKSELVAGDVVFFSSPSTSAIMHVGIYIGDGDFIHASKPGDYVKISTLDSGYYDIYYYGAKRIYE